MSDDSIVHLTRLRRSLTALDLSYTDVSGMSDVALSKLRMLRQLSLDGTPRPANPNVVLPHEMLARQETATADAVLRALRDANTAAQADTGGATGADESVQRYTPAELRALRSSPYVALVPPRPLPALQGIVRMRAASS